LSIRQAVVYAPQDESHTSHQKDLKTTGQNEDCSQLTPDIYDNMLIDVPMSKFTWFRTGGKAKMMYQPTGELDLARLLRELQPDIQILPIGIGSNLLVREGGYDGVVIRLSTQAFGKHRVLNDRQLELGSGLPCKLVAKAALNAGIEGLSFLCGIPGSLGGALRMNAGGNGRETVDVLSLVHAVTRTGKRITLRPEQMNYRYRHCGAPKDLIFVSAVLEGVPGDRDEIRRQMDEVMRHREISHPSYSRTCGSTFKNPPGHSVWKLIDQAGMRGARFGGAVVSTKHCNFLINEGTASPYDIEYLGETIRSRVLEATGVRLEWEVAIVGSFIEGREILPLGNG